MILRTSYFYQIRNFKPYMIPVSTACGDPAWYHGFTFDKSFTFLDDRGVVNGLRCEELHGDESCANLCSGRKNCKEQGPNSCPFLKAYRNMLENKLDLNAFMARAEASANKIKEQLGFEEEPIVVLMVHEAISNPCSERVALIDYFQSHNIDCKELEYPIK